MILAFPVVMLPFVAAPLPTPTPGLLYCGLPVECMVRDLDLTLDATRASLRASHRLGRGIVGARHRPLWGLRRDSGW